MTLGNMNPERARLKLQALLHDTPDKALILGRYQGGHEAAGRSLLQLILDKEIGDFDPLVRQADRIASGADRMPFARERYAQLVDFLKAPELRHPFDGRKYTVRTLHDVDPAALAEDLEATVRELLEHVPAGMRQDPERLYWLVAHDLPLALWGFDRESKLGALWQHLPADTRVPDHSIWEHTRLTSALAGAGQTAALLQVSIGPVQSFIASARRVSDLWAGSFLLSWLTWQAMEPIVRAYGADAVLLPDLSFHPYLRGWLNQRGLIDPELAQRVDRWEEAMNGGEGRTPSAELPNRFLCVVPVDQVCQVGEASSTAAKEAFARFCREGLEVLAEKCGGAEAALLRDPAGYPQLQARRQAEAFVQVQWSAVEWPRDHAAAMAMAEKWLPRATSQWRADQRAIATCTDVWQPNAGAAYPVVYKQLDRVHGAAKLVRPMASGMEPGHKCVLMGDLESLHPTSPEQEPSSRKRDEDAQAFWHVMSTEVGSKVLRTGERLSSIGLAKRLGRPVLARLHANGLDPLKRLGDIPFPSTHALGLADTIIGLVDFLADGTPERAAEQQKVERLVLNSAKLVGEISDRTGEYTRAWLPRATVDAVRESSMRHELKDALLAVAKAGELTLDLSTYEEPDARAELERMVGDGGVQVAAACRALISAIRASGIRTTSPYYGAIQLDGDRMGAWIAGDLPQNVTLEDVVHPGALGPMTDAARQLMKQRRPMTPARHAALSRTLGQFSRLVVPRLVEEVYGGTLIYAGGDDVLAFLPVSRLLPCLRDLRAVYSGLPLPPGSRVERRRPTGPAGRPPVLSGNGFVRVARQRGGDPDAPDAILVRAMGSEATCSAGAIVAHAKTPLRMVLDDLRDLERRAKHEHDRDAFCIGIRKRSGSFESVGGKWHLDDDSTDTMPAVTGNGETTDTLGVVMDLAEAFKSGLLGRRFAYRMRETLPALAGPGMGAAVEGEILRLLLQHGDRSAGDGGAGKVPWDPGAWARRLTELRVRMASEGTGLEGAENFLRLVGIAEFLGRDGRTGGEI